ncbi:MAG TPA: sulfurtransferase [Pedococcus sp.]|jgi:thiosulfate/3-mercaptopyruvate sulfurtransferase
MTALISPEELRDRLGSVVLVDVQWNLTTAPGPPGRDLYLAGHLPGAHHVDLDAELSGPPGPDGRHPMPTAHSVQQALRRCGVDERSTVVVYDQGPCMAAARAWWVFCYFGAGLVRVLDGGLAAWRAAGGGVTTEVPEPGHGDFAARPGGMPLIDAEGAAEVARCGVLLDARAPERYAGAVEPIDRVAGHIPGAVSAPTTGNTGPDGRFLPHPDLRDRFAGLGVTRGGPVGTYCGSGVTAAHQALALHEIGVEAPLYVGSWSHWITDPARPVATGPAPWA